jgi:hypothetical protein
MFSAFAGLGVEAEPVVYSDDAADAVREQLLALDGVLVWVNPVEKGRDRSVLDPLLRDVSTAGVWVSAHPDVVLKIATKKVLVDTGAMSWSAETHLYRAWEELCDELPSRLAARGALVLKQQRGMGGAGVWKIELDPGDKTAVRVQHAEGGEAAELLPMRTFLERCVPYFAGGGLMVEQPFLPRLGEGMIRVYLSHDTVVGFAHQYPRGLLDPAVAAQLPTQKVFELATAEPYQRLREQMETTWVHELRAITGVAREDLPVIWDADFLYGPKTDAGDDTYVLCEINASSTFAFPEHAMPAVAQSALDRISAAGRSSGGSGAGAGAAAAG